MHTCRKGPFETLSTGMYIQIYILVERFLRDPLYEYLHIYTHLNFDISVVFNIVRNCKSSNMHLYTFRASP